VHQIFENFNFYQKVNCMSRNGHCSTQDRDKRSKRWR